jgi:hypothetical protein
LSSVHITSQSQNESASKLKSESESPHGAVGKAFRIDERRISQLRAQIRNEELLHALIRNPEWLESLAKTSADLRSYQELLSQWQADGCPDLESWLAQEFPMLSQAVPAQSNDSISHS